jgi:hypothetical protein
MLRVSVCPNIQMYIKTAGPFSPHHIKEKRRKEEKKTVFYDYDCAAYISSWRKRESRRVVKTYY